MEPSKARKLNSEPAPTKRPKRGGQVKIQLDKDIESGNLQGKYIIVPPLLAYQLINEIIVDGNLKNLGAYYEHLDEGDQRKVE